MIKIRNDGNITLVSAAVTDFTDSIGYWHEVIKFALIGIVFPVANYIFFKKITFWNKGS